jgi:hypothetical protein
MSSPVDPAEQDERGAAVEAATLESSPQAEDLTPAGDDALPVLAEARVTRVLAVADTPTELARPTGSVLPAMQAAAVAAGGFVAGAAVVGLVHRHQRRSTALAKGRRAAASVARPGGRGAGRTAELVQIVGSRSLLVDVHLLGGPGER